MEIKQAELNSYTGDFSALNRTTQLVRENGIRAFLLHLHASQEMPQHQVDGPITVLCLQGSVLFKTITEDTELISGSLICLPAAVPHSLYARTASLMLVTVAD